MLQFLAYRTGIINTLGLEVFLSIRISIYRVVKDRSTLLVFFFFSFLFAPIAQSQASQQVNVKFIGVNNGLSHREVFAINHDQQGFIWFATRTGIDRYDGTDFLHFKYPDNYEKQRIKVANFKDSNDVIWLIGLGEKGSANRDSLHNQLLFFDYQLQQFLKWSDYLADQAPFPLEAIQDLAIVQEQIPIFSLYDGRRFIWDQRGFYDLPAEIDYEKVLANFTDCFYYFQENGEGLKLKSWNKQTGEQKVLKNLAKEAQHNYSVVSNDSITYLLCEEDAYFSLSYLTKDGISEIKWRISLAVTPSIFPSYQKTQTFLSSDETLWCFYRGAVYKIDPKERSVLTFNASPSFGSALNIQDFHFGALGNLWVGTRNGVYLYQFLESPFQKFLFNNSGNLIDNWISPRGLLVQDQTLIVNSYQGQFEVDFGVEPAQATLKTNEIYYPIIAGTAGEQYFGWDKLYRKIPGISQAEIIEADSTLGEIEIWSLQKDAKQQVWLGLENGLAILRPQDSTIKRFTNYNDFPALQTATVNHFLEIGNRQYLLATSEGIFELDIDQGITAHFHEKAVEKNKLPFNQFHHIHQSEDGIFWLASAGAGLIRWDRQNGIYQQYNLENGLSNEVLYFTYEDKRGFLWIGSDYGLIRFNKRYEELMVYLEKDGISHHEFNRISHFQAEDGTLYFGTINGVTTFNPLKILPKRQSDFPLLLTELTKLSEGARQQFNTFSRGIPKLSIRPNDRLYRLDFRLLDYWGAERCKYAYKISGFQEEWFELEEGGITIPGLPYGTYTLQVKGQDSNGRLSEKTLEIPIQVLKPWWKTVWFWLVLLVTLVSAIISFFIFRIRSTEKARRVLKELVQERTEELERDKKTIEVQSQELRQMNYLKSRFFVNIAHELRTPLTLLKGPISSVLRSNELGNRNFTMLAMAQNNLQKILQLIDEILDLGKLEEGKLHVDSKPTVLTELLDQILLNFTTLAQEKAIQLTTDFQIPKNKVILVDAAKLDKVIANLLSNAIRFSPDHREVLLKVYVEGAQLFFQVLDAGPGVPEEDLPYIFERYYQSSNNEQNQVVGGTGIGLAISREYGALLGGQLDVWNREEGGACFQLTLPYTKVDQAADRVTASQADKDYAVGSAPIASAVQDSMVPFSASLQKGVILIVEDHKDLRSYLQTVLEEDGWTVKAVAQGKAALDFLDNNSGAALPEIIMTDMMMPILSGAELVKALKNNKKYEPIPLLILTAKTGQNDRLNMLHLGVDDYLTKPFSLEELLARINNLHRNQHHRLLAREKYPDQQAYSEGAWLSEVESLILEHKKDFDFSVNTLATQLNMSRRQLYRKMNMESGLTPNEFIQEVKFRLARELLEKKAVDTVKALAFELGIKDVANFSKNYRKRFGKLPSEYL